MPSVHVWLRSRIRVLTIMAVFLVVGIGGGGADPKEPETTNLAIQEAHVLRPKALADRSLANGLAGGVAVVKGVPQGWSELASAYSLAGQGNGLPLRATEKMSIVAVGPYLDGPDRVQLRSLQQKGSELQLEIVYSSARASGATLMRNIVWHPVALVPLSLRPGAYHLIVTWQAVKALPSTAPEALRQVKDVVQEASFKID